MKKIWQGIGRLFRGKKPAGPLVIPRRSHTLSRDSISPYALKVLYRLHSAGYAAYLVGGGVREILLKRKPKDFDVATNATPDQIAKLFRNSRLIGRRFRLVHVFFQGEVIEVSTFRADTQEPKVEYDSSELVIASDNTYGTIEEDAWRRDFTINALYYNIADFSVVDYVGGITDLRESLIRMIGDPSQRFHEDPVRLLRAIRFASKLDFQIHPETESCVFELSHLLRHIAPARLFQEVLKLFFEGHAAATYKRLQQYNYFAALFPHTAASLKSRKNKIDEKMLTLVMRATDERFAKQQSLNPAFLLATVMWPKLQELLAQQSGDHAKFYQAYHHAVHEIVHIQEETVVIPRRIMAIVKAIWTLQYHLIKRRPSRIYRILEHRNFRAAYDFLLLRSEAGEPLQECVQWWQTIQTVPAVKREEMRQELIQKSRK